MTYKEKSFYEPFIVALTWRDLLDLSVIDSCLKPSHFQWGGRAEKHNRSDVLLQTHEILWIFSWPFCRVKSWNVRENLIPPHDWLQVNCSELRESELLCWSAGREPGALWGPRSLTGTALDFLPWVMSYEDFTTIPVKTFRDGFIFETFHLGFVSQPRAAAANKLWSQTSRRGERRNSPCCSSFSRDTYRLLQFSAGQW